MTAATAHEVAETLNRAFAEPSMTMAMLLADVIPALAELDQDATTAADPESYRDRIILNDGSITLYDPAPNCGRSARPKGSPPPIGDVRPRPEQGRDPTSEGSGRSPKNL
ncbi:hypothetical protein ACWKSP_35230 [Micromonosporaceae bacterium Da 78-11]